MSERKTVSISEADWVIAPSPSWVLEREPDWQFTPQDGFPVAFLLIDEQHDVATQTVFHRTLRRAMTHAAVQSLGQAEFEFDPAAHRLRIHELSIWRLESPDRWEKRSVTKREAFLIRQREQQLEQQMLNGRVSVVALIEDLRVNDVIELAWTLEPRDPMSGLRFTAFYAFAWSVPIARIFFTLHLNAGTPVSWNIHRQEGMPEPLVEHGEDRVTWSQLEPPLFVAEPNAPGDQWPFPMLEVSGWSEWSEVAEFIATLWEDALTEGVEDSATQVSQLQVAGDLSASVCASIRFVQENVRYLAVDFGHGGGILPNGAGTVLRRRFGDCKDKTVLLTSMLRTLGLEAWPLLVAPNWCNAVARLQPSTAAFSHAIVTFIFEGKRYTVDPTLIGQGGDLTRMLPPSYGFGLEVRKGASVLLPLTKLPPAEILLTEIFHLDRKEPSDGTVEQHLSATSWLANDLRAALLSGGDAAFFKSRAEALQKHFPALVPDRDKPMTEDNLSENTIELRSRHELPTWGLATEKPPAKFTYGAHGLFLAVEAIGGPEKRLQPWALRHPMKVRHKVIVKGRCVRKATTERHRYSGPGFSYSCDVTATRHEITFEYCWQTTESRIPPEKWPEYCKQRTKAFEHAGANVATPSFWLSKKPTSLRGIITTCLFTLIVISALSQSFSRPGTHRVNESTAELDLIARNMKTASEAANRGDYDASAAILEKLRPYYTRSIDYFQMRAEAAVRTNQFDRAKESIVAARQLEPINNITDVIEALLYERTGDFETARHILDRVISRTPEHVSAILSQARITEQLGDTAAALQAWQKLLFIRPADADGLLNYALLVWKTGDHQRADKAILNPIEALPTPNPQLEIALSNYYTATGRLTEAAKAAQRATQLAPSNPSIAFRNTMAQARLGNKTNAMNLARQMTQQFPEQASAWQALAILSATSDDPETAEDAFQKWLEITPNESEAHASYGYFKHKTGDTSQARTILEKAAQNYPGDGLVWMNYSEILAAQGETEAAKIAQQKARKLMSDETIKGLMR